MNITLKQRRFLIVWCCFHVFALAVNLIPIDGKISIPKAGTYQFNSSSTHYWIYPFTDGSKGDGFWPFVKFVSSDYNPYIGTFTRFFGVFTEYQMSTFFVYIVLGFAVIFIPKLWGKPPSIDNEQKRTSV